ncbi:MAG: hypothetical protein ACODAC_09765 [Pseudomonadota bacterium]
MLRRHSPAAVGFRIAACGLLAAAAASACTGPAGEARREAPASAADDGEVLLGSPPEGWTETAALATEALRMAEYAPSGESGKRAERVTFEAQSGEPLPDPIEFVTGLSSDLADRCQGYTDRNVWSGRENGYPTSVRLMICERLDEGGEGRVTMAKAIQGNDRFYVITRRRVVPVTEGDAPPLPAQTVAQWSSFLRRIRVCDTRRSEHPCPEPADAAGPPDVTAREGTPWRTVAAAR